MSILQTVRNVLSAAALPPVPQAKAVPGQQLGTSNFDNILDRMSRFSQFNTTETSIDVAQTYRLASTSAWVYSDIKLIADRTTARDANFEVKQRDNLDETIENHPFLKLLDRPNAFMSGSFLKRYTNWWLLLRGNAYIFISTPGVGVGEPTELWPLPSDLVRPWPLHLREGVGVFKGEQVIDYLYTVNGGWEMIPGEQIVHFRLPNPFDWWEGMSPLNAAHIAVEMDHAQRVWTRDFFKDDNAIPSAIISVPATTSPVDFERQRQILSEQWKNGQKRVFTRSGDLTVETITQTLEQMQIIQSREFSRDEIDRVYGIPQGLVSGGLSGDSRLAAEIAFARNTVQPLLDYMAEQWTSDISPYYSDSIVFEAPNVIPQDRALEIQEYTTYSQDMTINESRQERGLDPVKLPPELKELQPFVDLPIRLIQGAMSKATAAEQADRAQETAMQIQQQRQMQQNDKPPESGSMEGQQDPKQMVDDQAGKAHAIALDVELKRWKKVALKALRDGKAQPAFTSDVIDADRHADIVAALQDATTESEVKAAFELAPFRSTEWENYP